MTNEQRCAHVFTFYHEDADEEEEVVCDLTRDLHYMCFNEYDEDFHEFVEPVASEGGPQG